MAVVATTYGPRIAVSSPPRATFTTAQAIKVEGTVTDPTGVAVFVVNGNPVVPSTTGQFGTVVTLSPGVNTIVLEAANPTAQWSKVSLSVVSGQFRPDTQPIQDALVSRLNQGTFDEIAKLVQAQLGGNMLVQQIMARNPLYSTKVVVFGATIASTEINATNASFGQPTVKLTPVAGALDVHAEIPQVYVEVNAHDIGGIPYSITGHVTADNAIVDTTGYAQISNGQVTTVLTSVNVQLVNFQWGVNGIPAILTNLARSAVQNLIQKEIEKQIQQVVPAQVDKAIAAATQKPITYTILGSTASFTFTPTYSNFDPLGHAGRFDADVTMTTVAGYTPLTSPGSLVSQGGVPNNSGPTPSFLISANEDLMNRAGHAAWKAGVLDLAIDQTAATNLGMPAYIPLDAGLLQMFFPQLAGKMPWSDPIAIKVSPKLPPVVRAHPKPAVLQTAMGDLHVEFWDVAPGKTPALILSLAVHAKLGAQATLANNTLSVGVPSTPVIDASLVESPMAPDLNPMGVVAFIQFVGPPLVQIVGNHLHGFPVPVPAGLTPVNVDIDADGAQKTFLTVSGDF
jgi:hypothetical protein